MVQSDAIEQLPAPGARQLHFCGDTITFRLRVPESWQGRAWLDRQLLAARPEVDGKRDLQRGSYLGPGFTGEQVEAWLKTAYGAS